MNTVFRLSFYAYVSAVLCVFFLLHFLGERWWFATILLYGPRWIYLLPAVFFSPLAIIWKRRYILPLFLILFFITWQLMMFNVAFPGKPAKSTPGLRVVTYNVMRWEVSAREFSDLLEIIDPDIVALQECASPRSLKIPSKWHVKRSRSSVVVSRYPIIESKALNRGYETSGLYCIIETPKGPIGFCCVDLLTPRRALTEVLDPKTVFNLDHTDSADRKINFRWYESETLFKWVKGFGDEKILAGDFNQTIDSSIYRNFWSNYQNAFNKTGFGFGHTKKTKINIFRYRSRIDHILATPQFRPIRTWIGPDFGSDHLPLIAEFEY